MLKNLLYYKLLIIYLEERGKLFDEVEAEWMRKESKALQRQESSNDNDEEEDEDSSDEIEECIVKVGLEHINYLLLFLFLL